MHKPIFLLLLLKTNLCCKDSSIPTNNPKKRDTERRQLFLQFTGETTIDTKDNGCSLQQRSCGKIQP